MKGVYLIITPCYSPLIPFLSLLSSTLVLLLKSRADPHLQDSDGRTALYLAVRGGHLSCVQTLLEYGAKVSTVTKVRKLYNHHGDMVGKIKYFMVIICEINICQS